LSDLQALYEVVDNMVMKLLIVSAVGGLICLDRTCFQTMISRPVVIAPLTGLCLGDVLTGMSIGAFLELLWIDKPQIGIYVPPNDSLLAVMIVSSLLLAGGQYGQTRHELIAFAFLLFTPLGSITQRMDTALIQSNELLLEKALLAAKAAEPEEISRLHIRAIAKTFAAYFLFLFFSVAAGVIIMKEIFSLLPDFILKAMGLMYLIIPAVLIAVCLNTVKMRSSIPVFCALFLATMVIIEFIHAF
jgi:mannose/fructose/N-acetylgalactosamine-specific phosphotransferase system component IIC